MPTERASPLIDAATLQRRLDAGEAIVLLDARPDAGAWARAHLPGAQHADPDTQLSSARAVDADPIRGGRHPLPRIADWCAQLGAWGIRPRTPVVVYDAQSGANAAARAWWMLRAVGHEPVQALDGGLPAAIAAGFQLTAQVTPPTQQPAYPATHWQWPLADLEAVAQHALDPQWCVLDVRAAARYHGQAEPIDPVAGHIPGAVNLPYTDNLRHDRFLDAAELRAQYTGLLDGRPPQHLIVHCGSGVTACHTLLALEHAGLHGAALYVGSWSEWCRSGRPRAPDAA